MTVNVLTQQQKEAVVTIYKSKTKTIVEMARHLNVSPRTIGRVIAEAGLASPTQRLKGQGYLALKVLEGWGLTPEDTQNLLENMEDAGMLTIEQVNDKPTIVEVKVSPNLVRDFMVNCADDVYHNMLASIIHLREAKKQGTTVMTAMNRLRNSMEAAKGKNHG